MEMTLYLIKSSKINEIKADNSQNWDFDTSPSQYYDFHSKRLKRSSLITTAVTLNTCISHSYQF